MTARVPVSLAIVLLSAACGSGFDGTEISPPQTAAGRDPRSPAQKAAPGNANCAHFCDAVLPPGSERNLRLASGSWVGVVRRVPKLTRAASARALLANIPAPIYRTIR